MGDLLRRAAGAAFDGAPPPPSSQGSGTDDAMNRLTGALNDLTTAGDEVAALVKAVKVVLAMYGAKASYLAVGAQAMSSGRALERKAELDRLLTLANELGRTACAAMDSARELVAPVLRQVPRDSGCAETARMLSLCESTLQVFAATEHTLDLVRRQLDRSADARRITDEAFAAERGAVAAMDALFLKLRQQP